MKERPILFSGPMVRAILEGRKTQTRRVVKLPEKKSFTGSVNPDGLPIIRHELSEFKGRSQMNRIEVFHEPCPHGTVGDRLWVREAWGLWDTLPKDGPERARIFYRSTDSDLHECRHQLWRPSIHMPRWASRIMLEITGVRVERLQEISEKDAMAEGCKPGDGQPVNGFDTEARFPAQAAFAGLWESINGPESWFANPWVWVIEFRRVQT